MLFILTGDVQIGKSRWLEQLVNSLSRADITCYGVLAPGIWIESTSPAANDQGYEKLGINNVLLPDGILVHFAQRADIARKNGTYVDTSQAGQAKLGWHIDDGAIVRVNKHLATTVSRARANEGRKLLVVDELGRLELDQGGGLTEAMKLLQAGPQAGIEDALVVARENLASRAEALFTEAWGGALRITPAAQDANLIRCHLSE